MSDERTVRYGEWEIRDERTEQYVHVPGVFLAAPPRDLPLRERVITIWGRRRYEEWDEDGQRMGSWRWATQAECDEQLAAEEHQRRLAWTA